MQGPNDRQSAPKSPAANPAAYGGNDHNWTMHALTRLETSLSTLTQEVRSLDGKVATIDRSTTATGTAVSGMSHVNTHITETKVFMGKTDVRLEQMARDSVTKGQLAIWVLGAVLASIGAIFAAAFWLAEKYLLPLMDRLPPIS